MAGLSGLGHCKTARLTAGVTGPDLHPAFSKERLAPFREKWCLQTAIGIPAAGVSLLLLVTLYCFNTHSLSANVPGKKESHDLCTHSHSDLVTGIHPGA